MQSTSNILMIRPAAFGYNEQTADSNAFQHNSFDLQSNQQLALHEFDEMVQLLQSNGVNVTVIDDTKEPLKPDAIFPNNWVSFHENGDVILYPMQAENRRLERREDIIIKLENCFKIKHTIDLSSLERQQKFLEGTGSMVLDRENNIAYACLSPRTDKIALQEFCVHTGYKSIVFTALDEQQKAIYHTNVLMCIGSSYAVVCLDAISNMTERQQVITSLQSTNKELINITPTQLKQFAGNMLEVQNNEGKTLLVMSDQAFKSLERDQISTLSKHTKIVYSNLQTIETIGGGSARCMMAEIHLPSIG